MRAILAFVSTVLLLGAAFAQQAPGPSVTVLPVQAVTVAIGKSTPVKLDFRVNRGFHINSNKPNSEMLIPTALKLNLPTELMIANIKYPEGEQISLPFSPDEKLSVYTGDFQVSALVRAPHNASPGTYRVHGALKFQACNDRQCFPPRSTPIAFDVKLVKRKK